MGYKESNQTNKQKFWPNGLDPDQDRYFVGPVLGPNYLLRLSADNLSPS